MDFDVLVVVRLGGGSLAADVAREGPLPGVYPLVLRQVVLAVEFAATDFARVIFVHLVLPGVPDPVVLSNELTPAVVAGVRPDRPVRVHVGYVVRFPDEPARAHVALERFQRRIRMGPLVLLQVPVGAEQLVANRAGIRQPLVRVRLHVPLHARLDVRLVADGAHLSTRFQLNVLLRVRETNVSC